MPDARHAPRGFPFALLGAAVVLMALWLGAVGWAAWTANADPEPALATAQDLNRAASDIDVLSDEVDVLRSLVSSLRAELAEFETTAEDLPAETTASTSTPQDDAVAASEAPSSGDRPSSDRPLAAAPPSEAEAPADDGTSDGTSVGPDTAPETPAAKATVEAPSSRPVVTDGADLWSCGDFSSWEQAQAVYDANQPGDPNKIDSNSDGIACERLLDR